MAASTPDHGSRTSEPRPLTKSISADGLELLLTRRFDAPRALVWRTWADASLFARWWGPRGFTNPVCDWVPQPGRAFRVVMRGPDGVDNPLVGEFLEVEPGRRLVATMDLRENPRAFQDLLASLRTRDAGGASLRMHVTVSLADAGGGTLLSILSRFEHPEDLQLDLKLGAEEGWGQSFERLDTLLTVHRADVAAGTPPRGSRPGAAGDATGAGGTGGAGTGGAGAVGAAGRSDGTTEVTRTGREVVVTRLLEAPRELAFKAWTDPQHVARWWGPDGFTTTIHTMDVRPGGEWRFTMHGPDGTDFANRIVFVEVTAPGRLVYDHVSGPVFHVEVAFEAQGPRRTRVTMRARFDTEAALQRAVEEFGMLEGAKQHLGRLADFVARM